MQTRKEKFIAFAKTIKNKVHDGWVSFEFRHLRIARLIVYFMCLVVVVSICFYLFQYFNLFHTDVSSARYMLSALVQSQAAIVAIVITLTLIAVQLTASAYSPRVIDIFKKNPDMWILLSVYGFSIFYGFIVLKLVEGAESEAVSQSVIWTLGRFSISFEIYVSLAYWLGAFTFVALFPYMWNIIGLLKSENIIKRLAIEITKDKILNPKKDPVQPVVDIIHGSIMKYDLETTRVGLKTVTDQVLEIICPDDEEEISRHFCEHLVRVGRVAISREDEESTLEVIENLENFAKSAAGKGLEDATWYAASSLGRVGEAAAGKGLDGATGHAAWSLGQVGEAAAGKGLDGATQRSASSLGRVGEAAAGKGLDGATQRSASSLGRIGEAAAGKGLEVATQRSASSLGRVGEAAAGKGLGGVTMIAAIFLGQVGEAAAGKGLEGATWHAARSLGQVGEAAAGKGLEGATEHAAIFLGRVGEAAAGKGLEVATEHAAISLGRVGEAAAGKGLEVATEHAAKSLAELTILSEEKVKAERKGLEDATEHAAKSLAELTILSEEKVKAEIQDYVSKEVQDQDAFHKFSKIYEQELEKLRAKKN
jgi:hypothetical protein